MNHFALLRILFACFLLYVAWPYIPTMETGLEMTFWAVWLFLFVCIVGGNGLQFLQMRVTTGFTKEEQTRERGQEH